MLFEFDKKTGMLQCDVSPIMENKEHHVELVNSFGDCNYCVHVELV